MYKKDLALNNQQWLICHKTNPNLSSEKLFILVLTIPIESKHFETYLFDSYPNMYYDSRSK